MPGPAGGDGDAPDSVLLDILRRFREQPLGGNAQDKDIAPFFKRIVTHNNGAPEPHWYCEKAPPVVRESATFLIRLFAHQENLPIKRFKDALRKVLSTCEQCVIHFQEAKANSRIG